MITCKICEKEVLADKLGPHSQKCKDLIESKELLSSIIVKMKNHGSEALTMKHVLETNAAKQKKKQTKRRSCMNLVELGIMNHHMFSMSSESDISQPLSQRGSEREMPSLEEERTREGISTRDTLDNLEDALIMKMNEKDYRKFVKEVNRSLIVLKKVIMKTKDIVNCRLETNSICDVESNTLHEFEEDAKGIVDQNMQKFMRKFITDLESYIEARQRYLRAHHELTRVNSMKNLRDLKPKSFSGRTASFTQLGQASCPTKIFQKARPVLKKESPPLKPSITRRVPFTAVPTGASTSRKDVRKAMLQINPNQMNGIGIGNYVPTIATARRAPEDGMSTKDKLKLKLNLNFNLNFAALEKNIMSARGGVPSPNIAALNTQRKENVKGGVKIVKLNMAMCATTRSRAEQKTLGEKPQRKRTHSQEWFKTLRTEDSKGLSPFSSRDSKALTSRNPITEPILTLVPRPMIKGKKPEEDSDFVESLRECYSDYGPYRVNKQVSGQDSDRQHVKFDDFEIIKFIGKGAYGEVWLVKKKATGDLYAMKTVDWSNKAVQNKLKDIKAEKDIYQALEGDLVVKAFWTFHHENLICFVTEYMLGGDFDRILDRLGRLEEDQARFYFAELVLAVESLHNLKVLHRDLKPDNIMMDAKGHIRLTDFGLSRNAINKYKSGSTPLIKDTLSPKLDDPLFKAKLSLYKFCKTQSRMPPKVNVGFKQYSRKSKVVFDFLGKNDCHKIVGKKHALKKFKDSPVQNSSKPKMVGTPDYMAPEIIASEDYDLEGYDERCMDWWSMGVILYQFLVGAPAFCDTSIEAVFDNIKNRRIEWPPIGDEEDCISPEAADLIQQLLNPDPKKRLGARGASEVRNHDFFKEIDWATLREKQAPIIPCAMEDEQSTPVQTTRIFPNTANVPGHTRHSSLRIIKPVDFGAFRMRRLDLLDQANQQTHRDFQRKGSCLIKL